MPNPIEIQKTADGSDTLYLPEQHVHYHSIHGAITESKHVFIKHGLVTLSDKQKKIDILEMGLGTGLNALLSAEFSFFNPLNIFYTAVEANPLDQHIWSALNYPIFVHENCKVFYEKIHLGNWSETYSIHNSFSLLKIKGELQSHLLTKTYDLIYYDAFAPEAQEELWNEDMIKYLYSLLNQNGILVTYCAKGYVKRNFKKAGFILESLPGPPGKREMIRAKKIVTN